MRRQLVALLPLLALAVSPLTAQGGGRAAATARTVPPDSAVRQNMRIVRSDSGGMIYFSAPRNRAIIGINISLAPGANDRFGAEVEAVTPRGPADRAGIRAHDIITRVNDVEIGNPGVVGGSSGFSIVADKLSRTLADLTPGRVATLLIRRGESTLSLKVTPERDESVVATTFGAPGFSDEVFGSKLSEEMLAGRLKLDALRTTLGDSSFMRVDTLPGGGIRSMIFRTTPGTGGISEEKALAFMNGGIGFMLPDSLRRFSPLTAELGVRMSDGKALTTLPEERTRVLREMEAATAAPAMLRSSFDALSRLELWALNKDLGANFGTSEGVLVLSIAPPGVLIINGNRVGAQRGATVSGSSAATTGRKAPTPPATPAPALRAEGTLAETDVLNLKAGDVITAVDGRAVATPEQLMRILRSYQRNEEIKLSVIRQKKKVNVTAKMPM